MASQANPGNRGTTQTGYGKHADKRGRRIRTRDAATRAAIDDYDDDDDGGE